ncbi:hypothetical protein [Runella limosa]|uniref:hypothetical protein n=1 Tax=Runella limosa TaxID=370978 RepID=UPI0003FDCE1B|nr:hypothetical protein [Runella limosa]
MWIPIALAALNIGLQLYTGIANNQSLKDESQTGLSQAKEASKLAVIQSDAAYLAAVSEANQTEAALEVQKAQIEQKRKVLQMVSAVVAFLSIIILLVYFFKRNS